MKTPPPKEASLKFGNHFYQEYFPRHFEGCSRVTFFHLNDWDNDGDGE